MVSEIVNYILSCKNMLISSKVIWINLMFGKGEIFSLHSSTDQSEKTSDLIKDKEVIKQPEIAKNKPSTLLK